MVVKLSDFFCFLTHSLCHSLTLSGLGPVAWTSLKFEWQFRSFRVTHYVISSVILHSFNEWNEDVRQLTTIQFVQRLRNDVVDGVMRNAKWSWASLKFKWRSRNRLFNLRFLADRRGRQRKPKYNVREEFPGSGVVPLRHLRHVPPPDGVATLVNSLQNRVKSITLCVILNAKNGK